MAIGINLREVVLRITERIWLRAFGTSPKSGKAGLQIRSERYTTLLLEREKDETTRYN